MNVVFATAEFSPLARVGGLAAAAAGYVAELRRQGVDVTVLLPDYAGVALSGESVVPLEVPQWAAPAVARRGVAPGVGEITLINVPGIRRSHPYLQPDGTGWPDNENRFFAFSAAVGAFVESVRPDIVHLNDWHTCAALAHLGAPPPIVLTIHTLGYQGRTNSGWLNALPYRRELFEFEGDCNPLVGGIRGADLVITVSPNYAQEITRDGVGFAAASVLRDKRERLVGILNGIDVNEWNPAADPHLGCAYDATDLSAKATMRTELLDEFGLADGGGPVMAMVTRLAHQKGVDLVTPAAPFLANLHARLIVLGSGEQDLVEALDHEAGSRPTEVGFRHGYDEGLAHRIFAGADIFIMPSRFEPCGLAQMQAMRYGTLPLVTDVGGLHDTVVDVDAAPNRGTGVVVPVPSAAAIVDGMHRVSRAWAQPRRRAAMQRRGMAIDWSWEQPTRTHVMWYERLLAEARI